MTHSYEECDVPTRLAKPARRALSAAGIIELKQLASLSDSEVSQLHGMGPRAMELLRQALAEKGLSFATK